MILSRSSSSQWPSWSFVRFLASHVVVSAEAAKAVSQHGQGLIKLPSDLQQTLEGYFKESGLSGKVSKQQALALTEKLKALSRSTAVGGLQPYRDNAPDSGWLAHRQQGEAAMTAEQLQEQREMDREMEKLAAAYGPDELARYRATRAAAAAAAQIPLARTKGGRLKASTRAALEAHIERHGLLGLPHEAVRAAFDLPPSSSLMGESRTEAIKAVMPKYNATQALAYSLARFASCFAASQRIFKELAVRYSGFEPKTLLDFGAGPGTASWAAQEVWPSSLSRVTAVEPSAAMSQLGRRLEAARRFAHPHAPLVRWRPDMPPVARNACKKAQQQTYNIVVASYVLNELPSPQERAALVRQLWGVTNDMLVLIEPGTPAGFSNILEARSGILNYEGRRVAKLQNRLASATTDKFSRAEGDMPDTPSSNSSRSDAALEAKVNSKWFGAHVVAPCPHDAPCPLAVPGSRSWCHFGTRFLRPRFMQQSKALAGQRMNPADHQDERYSYVVLRRGSRPANIPQVDIRRSFEPKALTNSNIASAAAAVAVGPDAATEHKSLFAATADCGTVISGDFSSSSSTSSEMGSDQQQQHQAQGSEQVAAQQADASGNVVQQQLFSADEVQQLSSLLPGALSNQLQQQQQQQQQQVEPAGGQEANPQAQALNRKLGPYGTGLINRLIGLEDAGVDWSGSGPDGLTPQQLQLASQLAGNPQDSSASSSSSSMSPGDPTTPAAAAADALDYSSESGSETDDESSSSQSGPESWQSGPQSWQEQTARGTSLPSGSGLQGTLGQDGLQQSSDSDMDQEEDLEQDWEAPVEGLMEAASSSTGWSRIISPPRKRGGHVILDVCTGSCAGATPSGFDSSSSDAQSHGAAIVRHVVARSDAQKWMGSAGYALAKSANWGDLWPSAYEGNEKQQVVNVAREQ